jgi:hypothetical protein
MHFLENLLAILSDGSIGTDMAVEGLPRNAQFATEVGHPTPGCSGM